jgi:hypothetical protein
VDAVAERAAMTRSPDFVLRGPDALPVLAPYLCGFVPGRSLVVIGLDEGLAVRVTMRLDLPDDAVADDAFAAELTGPSSALAALQAAGADRAAVLVYPLAEDASWPEDYADDLPHRTRVDLVERALAAVGIRVLECLCVVGERSRSYSCEDLDCCPPEGRVAAPELADAVRAHFVEREIAVLPSRAALEASLDPRGAQDPLRKSVRRRRDGVLMRLPAGEQAQVEAFVEGVRSWARLPRDQVRLARLVAMVDLLLSTVGRRDLLLHRLTARPERALLGPARQVLAEAVRCADPQDHALLASAATTLAVCCWVDGDGAAAWVALDRAGLADPDYRLAALVSTALAHGLAPSTWSLMMAGLSAEELLAGVRRDPERWPA